MSYFASVIVAACLSVSQTPMPVADIAIIIDDIGYDYRNSRAAVELDHPFAYAVLPFSPHARDLARLANDLDKNVIVHLPMEADADNHALGPGALMMDMSQPEISAALSESLAAVPYAVGLNNHMGSRLTRQSDAMGWLMQAIVARGDLFFVDSRTTSGSVALQAALQADIAATARDVFIDNEQSPEAITHQLAALVKRAKQVGHALGIAHPHAVTIDVLRNWHPIEAGVRVIKLADYIANYRRGSAGLRVASAQTTTTECGDESEHAATAEYPHAQR